MFAQKLIFHLNLIRKETTCRISQTGISQTAPASKSVSLKNNYEKIIKPLSQMPSPPSLPILGHAHLVIKEQKTLHRLHTRLHEQYGDIVKLWLPGMGNFICVYNPEDSKILLSMDGPYPIQGAFEPMVYYRTVMRKDLFTSPGVFSYGEDWHKNRGAVQQDMMRVKSAMHYIKDIEAIALEAIEVLEGTREPETSTVVINDLLKRWAFESISAIFLHSRMGVLREDGDSNAEGRKIIECADAIFDTWGNLVYNPLWRYIPNFVPSYRKFNKAHEIMMDITKRKVRIAMDKLNLEDEKDQSIIAKLARKNGKESEVIIMMAMDALFAGVDTTSNTAAFLIHHLATNSDKQDILYEEICSIFGPTGRMDETGLNKMQFLKACLQESQRLLPIALGTIRVTTSDMVLSGYHIPTGTNVFRVGQITSTSPSNYEESHSFVPERWMRMPCHSMNNKNASFEGRNSHPFASLPFGHGPRQCIGKRFAQMEMYVLVTKLLQKYKFFSKKGEPVETLTEFVSRPNRDIKINLMPRT